MSIISSTILTMHNLPFGPLVDASVSESSDIKHMNVSLTDEGQILWR